MPEKPTRIPTLARTVRGSGPGLILVHGAGGSAQVNFGPILDDLAGNRTVVAVDLPGSGETPRSTTWLDPDQLADQVVAAADAEGLDTFALGGWSLGAPLAIHTAARHPDRVTALILTSPFARADATLDLAAAIWHDLYLSGDHEMVFRLQQEVRDMLQPGTSALFLVVNKVTPDKAVSALSKYGGRVLKTSLSDDAERELEEALAGAGAPAAAPA